MAGYVYGGTIHDAHKTLAAPKPRKPKAAIAVCGTLGGVSKHRSQGEPNCHECAEAVREYKREWRARVRANKGLPPRIVRPPLVKRPKGSAVECGTNSGYSTHTHKKEPICQPCRAAHNAYNREYKASRRAA